MEDKKIKVLHIGYGFRPWRGGGLIEYTEDLMEEQHYHGYEVFYFCSGRHYPFLKKTALKRLEKRGIKIFELINPPIYHGSDRGTLFDLYSPICESLFENVINEIKPDIIHIQELAGLPSSLIELTKKYNIPTLMTLQDYFLLCPTLKLFDFKFMTCMEENIGEKCRICCQHSHLNKKILIYSTLKYELSRFPIFFKFIRNFYKFLKSSGEIMKLPLFSLSDNVLLNNPQNDHILISFFQQRREVNILRLKMIDLLISQSHKVEEIYKHFLGKDLNICTLHTTIKHIELIKPKKMENIDYPIKFIVLNGAISIPKGAKILSETVKILNNSGFSDKFQLHIYGGLHPEIKWILNYKNVFYYGWYNVNQLNIILDNMHVGIIPSIWEEAYGYVGIEMLSKGIPIIGNKKGGIVDYVKNGETGFINEDNSAEGLANIMRKIIENPQSILVLNKKIINSRKSIVKTMRQHFYEIDEIYKTLLDKRYNILSL